MKEQHKEEFNSLALLKDLQKYEQFFGTSLFSDNFAVVYNKLLKETEKHVKSLKKLNIDNKNLEKLQPLNVTLGDKKLTIMALLEDLQIYELNKGTLDKNFMLAYDNFLAATKQHIESLEKPNIEKKPITKEDILVKTNDTQILKQLDKIDKNVNIILKQHITCVQELIKYLNERADNTEIFTACYVKYFDMITNTTVNTARCYGF